MIEDQGSIPYNLALYFWDFGFANMRISIPSFDNFSIAEIRSNLISLYRSGLKGEILNRIDVSLVVFEKYLINTQNGEYRELQQQQQSLLTPDSIARAARSLLPDNEETPSILLLLPTSEFVATSYAMVVTGEKMVRSALELQAHSLIPGYENELLMGVNGRRSRGVALWWPVMKANNYFAAFKKKGLFLSAIMPRSLAAAEKEDAGQDVIIKDEDCEHCVQLHWSDGAVKSLLSVNRRDLEQPEFGQQWRDATATMSAVSEQSVTRLEDWTALRKQITGQFSYCFFPKGSELASKRLESGKKKKIIAGISAAAMLLLSMPFISTWMQVRELEAELETYQELSQEARRLQSSIYDMEDEWGALYEYPYQQISSILLSLNDLDVIQSSLTSFQVNKGVVDIQGYTQDPAYLVELLAEKEEFFDVEQSRSTSSTSSARGDRFGIRMNLSGVDFERYESNYPLLNE